MPIFSTAGLPEPPNPGKSLAPANSASDPDLDAVWRVAIGLDLDDRSALEAEVLLWRICSAKSIPHAAIHRAINDEWKSNG